MDTSIKLLNFKVICFIIFSYTHGRRGNGGSHLSLLSNLKARGPS